MIMKKLTASHKSKLLNYLILRVFRYKNKNIFNFFALKTFFFLISNHFVAFRICFNSYIPRVVKLMQLPFCEKFSHIKHTVFDNVIDSVRVLNTRTCKIKFNQFLYMYMYKDLEFKLGITRHKPLIILEQLYLYRTRTRFTHICYKVQDFEPHFRIEIHNFQEN